MLVYQSRSRHSLAFPDGGIKNTEKKGLASWPPWSWEHNVLPPKQECEQMTQDHLRLDALPLPRSSSPTETYYHVPWCPISYRSRKGIKWRTVRSFTLASAVSHSGPFEPPSQWQKNAIIIASNRNVDHGISRCRILAFVVNSKWAVDICQKTTVVIQKKPTIKDQVTALTNSQGVADRITSRIIMSPISIALQEITYHLQCIFQQEHLMFVCLIATNCTTNRGEF